MRFCHRRAATFKGAIHDCCHIDPSRADCRTHLPRRPGGSGGEAVTPDTIREKVPNTPEEWVGFLAALPEDMPLEPFPPKSWLYDKEPFGWSWGTDTWMMALVPNSAGWVVSFSDDEGQHCIYRYLDEVAEVLAKLQEPTDGATMDTQVNQEQRSQ
jgi:hypothetical protein